MCWCMVGRCVRRCDYMRTCERAYVDVTICERAYAEAVGSGKELTQPARSIVFDNLIFFLHVRRHPMHTCVMLKGSHRKSFNVYVMKRLGCGQLYPQQAGHPAPLTMIFGAFRFGMAARPQSSMSQRPACSKSAHLGADLDHAGR
jgi:hypothetical protein